MDKPLDEQTGTVEIAGRDFKIPLMYIDSRKKLGRTIKDSVVLTYVLPQFKSILELKTKGAD